MRQTDFVCGGTGLLDRRLEPKISSLRFFLSANITITITIIITTTVAIFVQGLPGTPDGVSAAKDGTYWVALYTPPPFGVDFIARWVWLRRLLMAIPTLSKMVKPVQHGHIINVGINGKILKSLQDPTGNRVNGLTLSMAPFFIPSSGDSFSAITAITDHDGKLFIGSLQKHYVGVCTS